MVFTLTYPWEFWRDFGGTLEGLLRGKNLTPLVVFLQQLTKSTGHPPSLLPTLPAGEPPKFLSIPPANPSQYPSAVPRNSSAMGKVTTAIAATTSPIISNLVILLSVAFIMSVLYDGHCSPSTVLFTPQPVLP